MATAQRQTADALKTQIESLMSKATDTTNSDDALKFTQAALNAAQTLHVLQNANR